MFYQYLIIDENYTVYGTNDVNEAFKAAEFFIVYNLLDEKRLVSKEALHNGSEFDEIHKWDPSILHPQDS